METKYAPNDKIKSSLYQQQETTGVIDAKWESFNLAKFPIVQKTANYLESANDKLEKIQTLIAHATVLTNTVLAIIETIEWFFESQSLFWALFDLLIDMIKDLIHSFRSTGVYALDLVSYHLDKATPIENLHITTTAGAWFNQKIVYSDNDEEELENTKDPLKIAELYAKRWMRELNIYKEETYYEFIETICSAFTDVNDIPDPALYDALFRKKENSTDNNKTAYMEKLPTYIRPGRPEFGDGSTMGVILFAFCFQSPVDLAKALYALCIVLGKTPEALGMPWIGELGKLPSLNELKNGFVNEFERRMQDYEDRMKYVRGEEPNFYGVNLYQLLYPVFNNIDAFLDTLHGKRIDLGGDGFFDPIKSFIDRLNKWMEFIDTAVQAIQDLITIIEGFLMLSQMSMLKFKTNEGTMGVVETLRNAKGFYDQSVYNTKLRELGFDNDSISLISGNSPDEIISNIATQLNELEVKYNDLKIQSSDYLKDYENKKEIVALIINIKTQLETYISDLNKSDYGSYITALEEYKSTIDARIATNQSQIDIVDKTGNYDYYVAIRDENVHNAYIDSDFNTTYNDQIDAIQEQIDDLIARHNDPSEPDIVDYDSQLAQLNSDKAVLVNQQNESNDEFNRVANYLTNAIESFDAWKVLVNDESKLPLIDSRLSYLETQLNNLKISKTNYINSYNNNNELYNGDNGYITLKENAILAKEAEIISMQNELDYANNLLAYYTSNPPATTEQIALRDQYQIVANTYPARIATKQQELNILKSELVELKSDWNTIEINKENFISSNIESQETLSVEISMTKYFKATRRYEILISIDTQAYNDFKIQQETLCANIISELKSQDLSFMFDLSTYEKVLEIAKKAYGFDYEIPVPDIERINTMQKEYNVELEKADLLYQKSLNDIDATMDKMRMFAISKDDIEDIEGINNWWSPDKRMWYGGFLMCYGYPNETLDEDGLIYKTAINYTEVVRDIFVNGDDETRQRFKDAVDNKESAATGNYVKDKMAAASGYLQKFNNDILNKII